MQEDWKRTDHAAQLLFGPVSSALLLVDQSMKGKVQEIRLHTGQPLSVFADNKIFYVCTNGTLTENYRNGMVVTQQHIEECFRKLCGYAVHSHQEEISQGYISVQGGHRAGLGGTSYTRANGTSGMRDITSISLRVSRQICGCANSLVELLGSGTANGLLIAGPPGSGKTTILRDIARQLSLLGNKVAIIDERGEISAVNGSVIENDLGPNCDVIAGVEKGQGIMIAVRCLSPQYIICDELGTPQEIKAVSAGLSSGVVTITSIHAGSFEQLKRKPQFSLLLESGAFGQIVMLSGPGKAYEVKEVEQV